MITNHDAGPSSFRLHALHVLPHQFFESADRRAGVVSTLLLCGQLAKMLHNVEGEAARQGR